MHASSHPLTATLCTRAPPRVARPTPRTHAAHHADVARLTAAHRATDTTARRLRATHAARRASAGCRARHKLAIDEWRSHHCGSQVVMHRRHVGAYGLLSSAIFTSATLNLLGDDGCVVEHTDRDVGLSVILSVDVGPTPSNATLRTSTATHKTGAIACVDTTKPHSVTQGSTTTGALRASLTFYAKRSVVTRAGGRAMPHRERRLGSAQPRRRGGDVAPPLAR